MKQGNCDRRTFLASLAALGAMSIAGGSLSLQPMAAVAADSEFPAPRNGKPVEARVDLKTGEVSINKDIVVRYSACVGCYSSCGNRIKLNRETGSMIGVGGNPYNPAGAYPYLDFDDSLEEAYRSMSFVGGKGNIVRATLCGRGNATFDAVGQPGRITTPLKRAGKRGEGKWKSIPWNTLIKEVTEGGKLFADIGEDVEVQGFKSLHDATAPLDPSQPDLGPKSNQLVMLGGRSDGRGSFSARFASTFGTLNNYGHHSS